MKNTIAIAIIAFSATITGCQNIKNLANITVDIPYTQAVEVPAVSGYSSGVSIPGGISVPFPAIPVATNSKSYIDQYHTSTDKVISVSVKSLALQITSPAGQNFDFLDSVQLYISAPTQPEVLVAYSYGVAKGLSTLNLTSTNADMKNYFLQDTMYFRMQAHINATPPAGTNFNINNVFTLVANPLQ